MEILGYLAAILIGVTLGLIGGGGSILTVPVLVYILAVEPVSATAYSLFIVGLTSLFGTITYMRKDLVSYKTAVVFAVPAFIAVFLTRKFIIPAIPDMLFTLGSFEVTKNIFLMLVFAILMVVASISMIHNNKKDTDETELKFNFPMIFLEGFIVGILTGLVGAGGGFLIIPALVLLARLPMKMAVGTSLMIIAAKSLIGFLGDVSEMEIEWIFLAKFSVFAIAGIFLGGYFSRFIDGKKLKPIFGYFVLIMGVYILVKEVNTSLIIKDKGNNEMGFFSKNTNNVINLNSDEFEKQMKDDTNAVLLDTRTQMEYNEGHIPNSKLIDIMSPAFQDEIDALDRNKNYYVYCRSGNRSYHAGMAMKQMGFENVYNLEDGIISWYGEVVK